MAARRGVYDFEKEKPRHRLERKVYPEANVSGFSHKDQEVAFFTQVAALLSPDDLVLDFGAGRGEFVYTDPSSYRVWLQNFRGRCAHGLSWSGWERRSARVGSICGTKL